MDLPTTKRVVLSWIVLGFCAFAARAEKPPRIPVALGKWTGPHAGSFKSGLRGGISKECVVVRADKARVIIDGEVTGTDKPFKVRVIVKSPRTGDVVESREYTFQKPSPSGPQSRKMGHDVTEIARRAPE
jgi:hypothetical protein